MIDPVSVPFSYEYVRVPGYTAMVVHGIARAEAGGLVLEFRARPVVVVDESKGNEDGIRSITVPWPDVQSLAVREPWLLRPRLVLRTRSLHALADVPNAAGVEITLGVARGDRLLARELAATVELAIADNRLQQWNRASPPSLPRG